MAAFNNLKLTTNGAKALLAAQSGITLNLSKIGMGSGSTAENTESMTDLIEPKLMLPISEKRVDSGSNYLTVIAKMNNQDLDEGFYWRETGLFYEDPDGNDILFAYACVDADYDFVPAYSDQRYVKHIRIANIITDSADITIKESQGILYVDTLTFEEFKEEIRSQINESEKLLVRINEYIDEHTDDEENPHNVTAKQVGLGNVPNVATNDQTPTYEAANTLSNLTSGEKISAAFSKIAKGIYELIKHIANNHNPHSVTASQVKALPITGGELTGDLTVKNTVSFGVKGAVSNSGDNETIIQVIDSNDPKQKRSLSIRGKSKQSDFANALAIEEVNESEYSIKRIFGEHNTDLLFKIFSANNLDTTASGKFLDARVGPMIKNVLNGLTTNSASVTLSNDGAYIWSHGSGERYTGEWVPLDGDYTLYLTKIGKVVTIQGTVNAYTAQKDSEFTSIFANVIPSGFRPPVNTYIEFNYGAQVINGKTAMGSAFSKASFCLMIAPDGTISSKMGWSSNLGAGALMSGMSCNTSYVCADSAGSSGSGGNTGSGTILDVADLPDQETMSGSDVFVVASGDKAGKITLNNLIESMRLNGVLPIMLTQQEYDEKVQSGEISASDRKLYLIVNEQSG